MNEKGRATFSDEVLFGFALLFLDSKAIIKSMNPADLFLLYSLIRSSPKTAHNKDSNVSSTP